MRKLFNAAKIQFIMRATSQMWLFVVFIQPILYLVIALFLMKDSERESYSMAAIIGAGMMGTWSSILFSSGSDIDRERRWGTLEIIVGCPTPLYMTILGKALANSFVGLFSMTLAYLTALIFFDLKLAVRHPVLFILALILTILSVAAKGMIVCSLFTLSRSARGLVNVMEYPIFLLSGIMFPITILPLWTRPFSYVLSLTWGIESMRMAGLEISDYSRFGLCIAALIFLTALYMVLSVWLFRVVENKTRKDATLGVY